MKVARKELPESYRQLGYNLYHLKFGNDSRFYTLHLDDVIYYFDEHKAPIKLNVFRSPSRRLETNNFNNSMSAPVYYQGKLYASYKSDGDYKHIIYSLADKKIEKTIDISNYPELVQCKRWHFFDKGNPSYYFMINENGFLQRMRIE